MEDSESSWIFDSLLCFLHGPVWNAPLQSFIEEKSLSRCRKSWVESLRLSNVVFAVFEPDPKADNADFKSIYDDFRNLVSLPITSRCRFKPRMS